MLEILLDQHFQHNTKICSFLKLRSIHLKQVQLFDLSAHHMQDPAAFYSFKMDRERFRGTFDAVG